jgi:dolichyl-phosphate-mannose-protein mannosyltransferase
VIGGAALSVRANISALIGLSLLALMLRFIVLVQTARLGADEAVVGLMARHILEAGERPVFYWGQAYLGAADAYLVAGLFACFGFQPWLLYVPSVCASVALVPLTWAIAQHLGPPPTAFLAVLPIVLPPPMFSRMLTNAGGFALGFALLLAAVWCALQALQDRRFARRWILLFALLTGLAGWIWQPAVLALLPAAVALLIDTRGRGALDMFPVVVGLAPMLFYNVTNDFGTLASLAVKFEQQSSIGLDLGVLAVALGGGEETLGGANSLQAWLFAGALIAQPLLAVILFRQTERRTLHTTAGATLIVLVTALLSTIAAHAAARYLVPLVSAGMLLSGAFLASLARASRIGMILAIVIELAVVGVGNLRDYVDIPSLMASEHLSRLDDTKAALQALDVRDLRTGYADYWTAYPITYVSNERVTVAPSLPLTWGPSADRYPEYTRQVNAVAMAEDLFLLVADSCAVANATTVLQAEGATFEVDPVGRWSLIWHVRTPGLSEAAAHAAVDRAAKAAVPC